MPHFFNHFIDLTKRKETLKPFKLGVSGWRKVFSADGNEDSRNPGLNSEDEQMMAVAAYTIGCFFKEKYLNDPVVTLGIDSRPTGSRLSAVFLQGLLAAGVSVKFAGICAVCQLLAYTKKRGEIAGFVYISASHNPPGYNGIKIGGETGMVFENSIAGHIIERFKKVWLTDDLYRESMDMFQKCPPFLLETAYKYQKDVFKLSQDDYYKQICRMITGNTSITRQNKILDYLKTSFEDAGVLICCDFNGSARITSIDEVILKDFHVNFKKMGTEPGQFDHAIVPEGVNLYPLRDFMKRLSEEAVFGYVPDCDGDRGNLLYPVYRISDAEDFATRTLKEVEVRIPDAQFTFFLSVISELSFRSVFFPQQKCKTAVVANGPTSLVIDKATAAFGASFFRAEVGEANVLSLAADLRAKGFEVPVCGEGSNGGNMTFPSTVRDPLATVFSLLRFLFLKHPQTGQKPYEYAAEKLGIGLQKNGSPGDILNAFSSWASQFHTTSSFEKEAVIRFDEDISFKALKASYEDCFVLEMIEKEKSLETRYGITHYKIYNYEGKKTRTGPRSRTGDESGGFQIVFYQSSPVLKPFAFLWMRPSRTEPVFRASVCVEGSRSDHDDFLFWHKTLIEQAYHKVKKDFTL